MTRFGEAYLCQWHRYTKDATACEATQHQGTAFCETHLIASRLKAFHAMRGMAVCASDDSQEAA